MSPTRVSANQPENRRRLDELGPDDAEQEVEDVRPTNCRILEHEEIAKQQTEPQRNGKRGHPNDVNDRHHHQDEEQPLHGVR